MSVHRKNSRSFGDFGRGGSQFSVWTGVKDGVDGGSVLFFFFSCVASLEEDGRGRRLLWQGLEKSTKIVLLSVRSASCALWRGAEAESSRGRFRNDVLQSVFMDGWH